MLKIKDSVNLKELEKHGFELDCFNKYEKKMYGDRKMWLNVAGYVRTIFISFEDDTSNDDLDTLYDLIKAGLVEKVEE